LKQCKLIRYFQMACVYTRLVFISTWWSLFVSFVVKYFFSWFCMSDLFPSLLALIENKHIFTFFYFFFTKLLLLSRTGWEGLPLGSSCLWSQKEPKKAANLSGHANHPGYPTFFGRRVSMGRIPYRHKKRNLANIQPSWPHTWRTILTHIYCTRAAMCAVNCVAVEPALKKCLRLYSSWKYLLSMYCIKVS